MSESKRPRPKTISDSAFARHVAQASEMMARGGPGWAEARPAHFVALYSLLHERVYGVAAGELTPQGRLMAAAAAGRMLARDFVGNPDAMAGFIRWVWIREEQTEKWRRANGREGRRIEWRLQFGAHLVTDYRLAEARRKANPGR